MLLLEQRTYATQLNLYIKNVYDFRFIKCFLFMFFLCIKAYYLLSYNQRTLNGILLYRMAQIILLFLQQQVNKT